MLKGVTLHTNRWFQLRFRFCWFDFWVGFYVDTANAVLYVCPLPMIVFAFAKARRMPEPWK